MSVLIKITIKAQSVMISSVSTLVTCEAIIVFVFSSNFPTLFQYTRHFQYTRQGVPSLHTCAVRHRLARLCPTQLVVPPPRCGLTSPARHQSPVLCNTSLGSALLDIASRHCSALHGGIAKSSALPTGRLGLSCALWSVNEYTPVFM